MKNLTELLSLLGLCGIVFLSYLLYGILRKKQLPVATAINHCNLVWGIVVIIHYIFTCVSGYKNLDTHSAPFLPMLLLSAFLYCFFYMVIFAIGQFAKWILEKQMKK